MMTKDCDACADARQLAQEVLDEHADRIRTHYEGCWRNHAGCLAKLMLETLR